MQLHKTAEEPAAAVSNLKIPAPEPHMEQGYRNVFEYLPCVVIHTNGDGICLNCHGSDNNLMYFPAAELLGKRIGDVLPQKEAEMIMASIHQALAQGSTHDINYTLEINDTIRHFASRTIKHSDQEALLFVRDISELMRLQQDMARLDELNLVGEIAASIGHEVRNPLTTVRGFLQMLSYKKESAGFKNYFDIMIEELDRANTIITEFLSLARTKKTTMEKQSLNTVIQALAPLLQSDATIKSKSINLKLSDLPVLPLNAKEIRQLILNLARNGLEAMKMHGELTICTYMENNKIVLAVKDQGPGIPPEHIAKLGTPFFTTKETGTGLGLTVCYNIAAKHNAAIEVDSSPQGTTFYIRFPFPETA